MQLAGNQFRAHPRALAGKRRLHAARVSRAEIRAPGWLARRSLGLPGFASDRATSSPLGDRLDALVAMNPRPPSARILSISNLAAC